MSSHLQNFSQAVEKLTDLDIVLPELIILLSSLSASFENFVLTIESRDELPSMSVLTSELIDEELRRSEKESDNGDSMKVFGLNNMKTRINQEDSEEIVLFAVSLATFLVIAQRNKHQHQLERPNHSLSSHQYKHIQKLSEY